MLIAGLLWLGVPAAVATDAEASVVVDGTAFQIRLPDGRLLAQEQLPGTLLTLGDGSGTQRHIRIDAVEHDTRDPSGEIMLYRLAERDSVTGAWRSACEPDPDGRRIGFPLAGAFTAGGTYQPAHGGILITCTGGAEGKCVRFGYKPWRSTPDWVALEPYYQACVRLIRADYGGDGIGHTRNGTPIDLFDHIGVQRDETAPGMTLEATFGPDGAVCVSHTRLPDVLSLRELAERYPFLSGHLGVSCDTQAPALLFVRSFDREARH